MFGVDAKETAYRNGGLKCKVFFESKMFYIYIYCSSLTIDSIWMYTVCYKQTDCIFYLSGQQHSAGSGCHCPDVL